MSHSYPASNKYTHTIYFSSLFRPFISGITGPNVKKNNIIQIKRQKVKLNLKKKIRLSIPRCSLDTSTEKKKFFFFIILSSGETIQDEKKKKNVTNCKKCRAGEERGN